VGIVLDDERALNMLARSVHNATVVVQSMPLANATNMTDEERDLIDRWYSGRMLENRTGNEQTDE
jgi:uncharacterized membrane protein